MASTTHKKQHTEEKVIDALFALMKTDPIEKITVSEICGLARINRSTFYNHFLDIYDVRERYEQRLFGDIQEALPVLMVAKINQSDGFSTELIEQALGPHFDKLEVLLNGGDPQFPRKMTALARKNFTAALGVESFTESQEYIFSALAGMQLSLLGHWLNSDRSMPLDDLVLIMQDLIEYGPKRVMLSHGAA